MGYVVAWFGESVGLVAIGVPLLPFFIYLFASCWIFYFIANDIRKDLTAFYVDVKIVRTWNAEKRTELMKQFIAIVQIYGDAKQ